MATTTLDPAAPAYRSGLYEWLTTTDHKKIGIMYLVNSFLFFLAGGILALVVRLELARPGPPVRERGRSTTRRSRCTPRSCCSCSSSRSWPASANYVVPLQIGAPDMAFPRINALSFWLLPLGGAADGLGLPRLGRRGGRRAGRSTRRCRAPSTAAPARTCGSWA